MATYPQQFEEMRLTWGNFQVSLEWIGEGTCGDYDEEDMDDIPLLRFSCYKYDDKAGEFAEVNDASYCTNLHTGINRYIATRALLRLMEACIDGCHKREFERLSWMREEDFL